jgi:hypothetical protein
LFSISHLQASITPEFVMRGCPLDWCMDEKWFVLVQVGAPHHFDKMFFRFKALFYSNRSVFDKTHPFRISQQKTVPNDFI